MADILIEENLRRLGHVHRMNNNTKVAVSCYKICSCQLCLVMGNQGRPRLRFTVVVIEEKHEMERHQSQPMVGECQRHTHLD